MSLKKLSDIHLKTKILLDTDIGSDIDDAICLSYLLANSDCDLVGITTVSGEPEKRANIAKALCDSMGKEVTIIPGKEDPLIITQRQPKAEQAKVINFRANYGENASKNAIDFMRQIIHENDNEITLLAIGPLTNVATLFLVDPEIPYILKDLVMMCGSFFGNSLENIKIEWNALCDPHAAMIVYQAPVKKSISVGLDVTQKDRKSVV